MSKRFTSKVGSVPGIGVLANLGSLEHHVAIFIRPRPEPDEGQMVREYIELVERHFDDVVEIAPVLINL
jgi:hypothetical protein